MSAFVNTAVKVARMAGDHIIRQSARMDRVKVAEKGPNDYVTQVDKEAEGIIIENLHKAYPAHNFLGEESGVVKPNGDTSEFTWIIDPIDGTTNFIHGFPAFSVSIALRQKDRIIAGVVYDPVRQELFTAARGEGAQVDNRKIRVTRLNSLQGALIGTGMPFNRSEAAVDRYLESLREVMMAASGIRRAGSAALDLAWVAAGRLDGFWEYNLKPWDIAAGSLLVEEAGGVVSDLKGEANYLVSGNVVCGGLRVHQALRDIANRASVS